MIKQLGTGGLFLTLLTACSQLGPDDGVLKKSLQLSLPAYWEVGSLNLENRENLGTQSDPSVQSRFKAIVRLKEDTFNEVESSNSDSYSSKEAKSVIFISQSERKGKAVELYGVASSRQYMDSWRTDFRFDNEPMAGLGQPRSFFRGKTVLKNSQEEQVYKVEQEKQAEKERKESLEKFTSKEFTGDFRLSYTSYPFTIRFTSVKPDTQYKNAQISGQIAFQQGATKGFSGTWSENEVQFKVDKVVKGSDSFGIGTEYSFLTKDFDSYSNKLKGQWKHTNNATGDVAIIIPRHELD